jgi:transcription initiation factor TFIID subunit TAF12
MSDSIISRKELQQQYRKSLSFDPAAEDLLLKLGEDFFIRVIDLACKSTNMREGTTLEIEDIKLVLERFWDIKVPEFEKEESSKLMRKSQAKAKREAAVRKTYNAKGK